MALVPEPEDEIEDLKIRVSEVMTPNIISVEPSVSVADVAEVMDKHGIGSVLVRSNERIVGIITERDIIMRCVAKIRDRLPSNVRAEEIMTKDLITISGDADIFEAAKMMSEYDIRRLIVVDNSGKPMGIISMKDILREAPHIWFILSERLRLARSPRGALSLI
ncbi:MAG TPA: CBS domain-containing protein [Candidatus Korarchaeota archaeon]|nr:CBS domain-containing protein [Candidatus Korarchaeota archaeon]